MSTRNNSAAQSSPVSDGRSKESPLFEALEPRLLLSAGLGAAERIVMMPSDTVWAEGATQQYSRPPLYDAGDYTSYFDEKVRMLRVANEFVVGLADGADANSVIDALTGEGKPLQGFRAERKYGKNLLSFVSPVVDASLLESSLATANSPTAVEWTSPIFWGVEDAGGSVIVPNEVVVALDLARCDMDLTSEEVLEGILEPDVINYKRLGSDRFILDIPDGGTSALAAAERYQALDIVRWAEPNWYFQVTLFDTPNDTFYGDQWNLHNTATEEPKKDADIDAPEAWDTAHGSDGIVIAIMDDGVETGHEDLNMWVNPGEIDDNEIDDDGNGWEDDINGWDFYGNDGNPNPTSDYDKHGTAVAGVAGAVGDNGKGISGVSQNARIMALRVVEKSESGLQWATATNLGKAIRYAAGQTEDGTGAWQSADVLNCSWGLNSPYPEEVTDALSWAHEYGRGGRGLPVFCAAGNDASGYVDWSLNASSLPAGDYEIEWSYYKDSGGTAGDDTVWLANVTLPDASGTHVNFMSSSLPDGWSTSGVEDWTLVNDIAHSHGSDLYTASHK